MNNSEINFKCMYCLARVNHDRLILALTEFGKVMAPGFEVKHSLESLVTDSKLQGWHGAGGLDQAVLVSSDSDRERQAMGIGLTYLF